MKQLSEGSPLVSVVMAVYNGDSPEWLAVAIESILNQTYQKIEYVIVTDGLTSDDLIGLLNGYAANDPRVKVSHEPKHNLSFALNSGIAKAKGDFIARMDADDISVPDRIERQVAFLLANPEIDIVGTHIIEFESGTVPDPAHTVSYPLRHDDMKCFLLRRNPLAHVSVLFRRSFFRHAGTYPHFADTNQDTLLWLSGFMRGCRFANIPSPLVLVRFDHATARRRKGFKKSFSDFIDRLTVITKLKGGGADYVFAVAMFLLQNMPGEIYRTSRRIFLHRKQEEKKCDVHRN